MCVREREGKGVCYRDKNVFLEVDVRGKLPRKCLDFTNNFTKKTT